MIYKYMKYEGLGCFQKAVLEFWKWKCAQNIFFVFLCEKGNRAGCWSQTTRAEAYGFQFSTPQNHPKINYENPFHNDFNPEITRGTIVEGTGVSCEVLQSLISFQVKI